MNHFVKTVKELRSDISDWLVHFTRGKDAEAADTLAKILDEATLRSFHKPPAICFSEAPLGELNKLFLLYAKYNDPRFAPFGVAVRKDWLFARGGRPVIYGPPQEKDALPEELRYRHVSYIPPEYDFTWMREWRIPVDHLHLERENTLAIFPTETAAFGVAYDVEVDFEYEGHGEEASMYGYALRGWYSLSLEEAVKYEMHCDQLIAKTFTEQQLEEPTKS